MKLIIVSGLPGTGKSSLASRASSHLQIPLLGIDEVVDAIPGHMSRHADPFWEEMIQILLTLVKSQLELGLSVIVDSVFMGPDRLDAEKMAARQEAAFRPIYTYVSDENIWRQRVEQRVRDLAPEVQPATWSQIQEQRKSFWPWEPGSALFVDSIHPLDTNFEKVLAYINFPD